MLTDTWLSSARAIRPCPRRRLSTDRRPASSTTLSEGRDSRPMDPLPAHRKPGGVAPRSGSSRLSDAWFDEPVTTREQPAGDFDYEQHGVRYAAVRRPDPQIEAQVRAALGPSRSVLNVGAGAGSYEPIDRYVLAVEPSAAMRAQRPAGAAPAVDAAAEHLPFDDDSFDAAVATMTVHQWSDVDQGLREMRRVSRGPVVVMTIDAPALRHYWLADYIPEVVAVEEARFPAVARVIDALAQGSVKVRVAVVPVPRDCTDGFGEAFYARPEAFLNPEIRASTSGLVLTSPGAVQRGLDRLEKDLASGAWDQRYGYLREQTERYGAIRLVTATA